MNKQHYSIIVIVFLCLLPALSCTKLKDNNYNQVIVDQFEPDEKDLEPLVAAAYIPWRKLFNFWQSYFWAQELSADNLLIPKRPWGWVDDGGYRRFHYHKWTSEDAIPVNCWTRTYEGINNCNRVIEQIATDVIPVSQGKENILAELKVLRASYYWVLCDMYGNVPIVTDFTVPEGYLPEQNTRKEVYDFIVKEITESIPLLSENRDQSTYGRFNQWAARTLLAKVYLNAEVYSGTPAWNQCLAQCDTVISSGLYSLELNQKGVFITENERSPEIIFPLPFDEKYVTDWNAFDHHMQTLPQECQATYNLQYSPWGGICAVPQFINTFDPDDARYKDNWIKGQQYSSGGEALIVQNGRFTGQPLNLINVVPAIDTSEAIHGFRLGKFEIKQGITSRLSNDFPLLRYADVILMKAECLLRTGRAAEAAVEVTKIRQRCFADNPAKATVTAADLQQGSSYDYGQRDVHGSTSEGGADVQYGRLLDELGWEFFEECHRRQDLIRFNVFARKSWLSHTPNGDYRELFPIPQSELNKNTNLQQNAGY
ncbi:RagB/SusD family nutrient uptake outer membrane protein [Chitinophaga japonensis]|uniref:Putative outer membrane starch-binding protein n=1 Tax=Chitinophaga japonensis TaxID=104662 RepID=A0A562T416_CHIJA|nr:RagB/SusD family nutrient uptake outer membrane protein [Chitinophaga japonensis]TWI87984.1 putative outer membrane starch-binding protein [Chitinophaga japonensis]